ncbi:MAG: heme A synthase [Sphingomonadales bacterium]|nr:heme A synthase [Sphingomonadales bacterium]
MQVSRRFLRFQWLVLILIFLVVFAGSFVRMSGSGMGCPDWPKCFGKWIPPTELSELPSGYQEAYLLKRQKKVEKFCALLSKLGMASTAKRIKNDPTVYVEEAFNARKTWTEYINRLAGFLAGNAMLLGFGWLLLFYRKRKWLVLAGLNLVLMGLEAWFGSIVVATNLVPWTITVHLMLALIIIAIQLYLLHDVQNKKRADLPQNKAFQWLSWLILGITFYQMFLGTQVREAIDALVKKGYSRAEWIEQLGMPFFIHRSFSWLVLILLSYLFWKNRTEWKYQRINVAFYLLAAELFSGVALAYADMPGLVQTAHLVFASLLLAVLLMVRYDYAAARKSVY